MAPGSQLPSFSRRSPSASASGSQLSACLCREPRYHTLEISGCSAAQTGCVARRPAPAVVPAMATAQSRAWRDREARGLSPIQRHWPLLPLPLRILRIVPPLDTCSWKIGDPRGSSRHMHYAHLIGYSNRLVTKWVSQVFEDQARCPTISEQASSLDWSSCQYGSFCSGWAGTAELWQVNCPRLRTQVSSTAALGQRVGAGPGGLGRFRLP